MADQNKKEIIIEVGSEPDLIELKFRVGITEFNNFQNAFLPNNKVGPGENFLTACIAKDQREQLIELCDMGFAVELANELATEFKPDLAIRVKK